MKGEAIPYYDVDRSTLNYAIYNSWPQEEYRILKGKIKVQEFYNNAYTYLNTELDKILIKYHPAGIIVEAYKQLEIWSVIQFDDKNDFRIIGPKIFAPIGRYGWRYVIEKSLERSIQGFTFNELRPSISDQNKLFTILLGLSYASELSNSLQFLDNFAKSVYIEFSPFLLHKKLEFEDCEEADRYDAILKEMPEKIDWKKYPQFSIENPGLTQKVNDFLLEYFQFSYREIQHMVEIIITKICNITHASITVQPYEDFIELIEEQSKLSKKQIEAIIDLAFLSTDKDNYEIRNYLKRSQPIRMINHCGIILPLTADFEAIYDPFSATRHIVKSSQKHVIISPALFTEWIDIFVTKLALGQRSDLKVEATLKSAMGDIERFFRRNIFESEVKNICRKHGYECISIDEVQKEAIECGEIDIIAYNILLQTLLVIECKSLAPSLDFKACRQVLNDHLTQKKYHAKFIKKIKWVDSHLDDVKNDFYQKTGQKITYINSIEKLFVTASFYVAKYFIDDYEILTFYELDDYLSRK